MNNCIFPTGVTSSDCGEKRGFGGLLKIYLGNKSHLTSVVKNSENLITGLTMSGGSFYEFEFVDEIGGLNDQNGVNGTNSYVNQSLTFSLRNITQAKKEVLSKLHDSKIVALVQESTSRYVLLGESGKGLKSETLQITSGTGNDDLFGANLVLSGASLDFANEVESSVVASVIA